jgi:hypothetical protein
MRSSFYQYSLADLQQLFADHNLAPSGPGLLFNWHYKKRKVTLKSVFDFWVTPILFFGLENSGHCKAISF